MLDLFDWAITVIHWLIDILMNYNSKVLLANYNCYFNSYSDANTVVYCCYSYVIIFYKLVVILHVRTVVTGLNFRGFGEKINPPTFGPPKTSLAYELSAL